MANLFTLPSHCPPDRAALMTPDGTVDHGTLRRTIARIQRTLGKEDPERVLLLAGEPPQRALPAFIAQGALGRTAAMGDARWSPETRDRVTQALSTPLTLADLDIGGGGDGEAALTLDPDPKRPFYMGFTSGTTGLPKAYLRSHASWIATMEAARSAFELTPGSRILALGPLSHSLALYAVIQALWLGGTALMGAAPDTAEVVIGVPPLLAAQARSGPHRTPRLVLSAGQALDPTLAASLARAFPEARIIDFYGTSEQSFIAWRCLAGPGITAATPPGAVGRPFPGVRLSVTDGAGQTLPRGQVGRLRVASPMVFDGYLPGLESGGFARDGAWTTVGDQGWLDGEGTLHLAGREGGMVVVRGVNVFPEAVEAHLKALPGVTEAGVVGLPDGAHGARLIALVEGRAPTAAELAPLPPEQRPRRVIAHPQLPRTASGKVDRGALRALALDILARE